MRTLTRRSALLGSGAIIGAWATRRFQSSNPTLDGTTSLITQDTSKTLDDASLLSRTPIHKHIILKDDPNDILVDRLRTEIKEAQQNNRPVNISAARHSMGGQSIPRNGTAITHTTDFIEFDTDNKSYRCGAGLRWASAIAQMDAVGFSPKVMQSNNDFGIASTFCVNAHGWPVVHSGMGSTVNSFKMILADGQLVTCSRSQNSDLFNLTMGGYGLTGLITELDVQMSDNKLLSPTFSEMPSRDFGPRFVQELKDETVNMAYGRLNVNRDNFFEDALMISYRPTNDQSELPSAGSSGYVSKAAAKLFRAQLGNERMKRARWWVETDLGARVAAGDVTRNTLINEPVVTLDDHDSNRTDILHEYFVAPERFAEFVDVCRNVIPSSYQEMLNITLRYVTQDDESYLSYATTDRIACVMLFSQEMTARAEADHKRMTQELIDGVHAIGGSYYLPYRPHTRLDQFVENYERASEFAAQKRLIDPQLILRNNLWDSYLAKV